MSAKVELSKPIAVEGDQVSSLELRDPTVEDVMEIGYPFLVMEGGDDGTAVQLRPKTIMKYVSRLAAVPPSSLKTISLGDLSKLQTVVMGFFGDEAETTPTETPIPSQS